MPTTRDAGDDGRRAALGDQFAGPGDAQPHSQPRKSSPAISTSIVLRPNARSSRLTWRRSSSASVRSVLPCKRSAPAARNCARHLRNRLAEISCPRQGAVIVFGPRNDASTSLAFCCAGYLRYLRVWLIDPLDRVERPNPLMPPGQSLAGYAGSGPLNREIRETSTPRRGPRHP